MSSTRRFTGRQITTIVAMLSAAIVLAPVGAVAATNAFTISDPAHPDRKAHVTSEGGLAVTTQDGRTGVRAKVDKSGHTVVGDGSGPLTVDGTVKVAGGVSVNGTVHSYAPAARWRFTATYNANYYDLTPPRADTANLSDLFLGGDSSTEFAYVAIYAATTPASATANCNDSSTSRDMIWQGEVGGSAHATTPISVTFATPLSTRPVSGKKTCLFLYLNHSGGFLLDAGGYYGS